MNDDPIVYQDTYNPWYKGMGLTYQKNGTVRRLYTLTAKIRLSVKV